MKNKLGLLYLGLALGTALGFRFNKSYKKRKREEEILLLYTELTWNKQKLSTNGICFFILLIMAIAFSGLATLGVISNNLGYRGGLVTGISSIVFLISLIISIFQINSSKNKLEEILERYNYKAIED